MSAFRFLLALAGAAATFAHAQQPVDCTRALPSLLTRAHVDARVPACNRDVLAAAKAVDAAMADVRTATQRPNPTLTVGAGSINPQAGVGAGGLRDKAIDSSVRLEQLVERGGKATLRTRQAEANRVAVLADLGDALRQQRAAARTAFFELAAAQARLASQREFAALSAQSAEAAARRLSSGEISRMEESRFRLDAFRAANDLRQAESDVQRARVELAKAIGAESQAATIEVQVDWPDDGDIPGARGDRADVAAARARVEAAEAARDLAASLGTRDVTVGIQADHYPSIPTNTNGNGNFYGVSVSIPLFVRHGYEGEKAKALADLEAARLVLARTQAVAAAEAEAAREDWRAASERARRLRSEAAPAAREVAEGAEFAYQRGATGILDLLDARRSLKTAELEELQARAEAAKAWARYEAAREPYRELPDAR